MTRQELITWLRGMLGWLGFEATGIEAWSQEQLQRYAVQVWHWLQQATVDALVMVESAGDPDAHRPGSQFYGLLQMGKAAGIDVGINDTSSLLGRPNAAVQAFWDYQKRYEERTGGHPFWMAVLWHDGPGNLRKIQRAMDGGASFAEALTRGTDAMPEYFSRYEGWMRKIAAGFDVAQVVRDKMAGVV